MIIAILILAGIWLLDCLIDTYRNESSNLLFASGLNVLLWWTVCKPVGICLIVFCSISILIHAVRK